MADVRVSELADAGALKGDELIMISQDTGEGLASCKITLSGLADFGFNRPGDWFAPGEYIFAGVNVNYTSPPEGPGNIAAGSELLISGIRQKEGGGIPELLLKDDYVIPGSWSARGYLEGGWKVGQVAAEGSAATLFRRVDGFILASAFGYREGKQAQALLRSGTVRKSRWVNDNHTALDCEIHCGDIWLPFTATADDCSRWGREIFSCCAALLKGSEESADADE